MKYLKLFKENLSKIDELSISELVSDCLSYLKDDGFVFTVEFRETHNQWPPHNDEIIINIKIPGLPRIINNETENYFNFSEVRNSLIDLKSHLSGVGMNFKYIKTLSSKDGIKKFLSIPDEYEGDIQIMALVFGNY